MAREKYLYTEFSLNALKDRVQEKSGIQVINKRCSEELANELASKGFTISASTLARFLGVTSSNSLISRYNLDQLSKYIGYNQWDDFHKETSGDAKSIITHSATSAQPLVSNSELLLVKYCLQDGAYAPLINYIEDNKEVFSDPFNPKTEGLLCTFSQVLNSNSKIRPWLFSLMLEKEYLARNYFDHQINADAIATYFGDAIGNYYLKLISPNKSSLYQTNLTWAYTILMMQAFYQNNTRALRKYGYELFRLSPPEENTLEHHLINGQPYAWVFARYHFVHFLYLYYTDKATSKTIEQKVKNLEDQLSNAPAKSKVLAYSLIFEALTHIGYSDLITWFTDDYITLLSNFNERIIGEDIKALTATFYFYTKATLNSITSNYVHTVNSHIDNIKDCAAYSQRMHLFGNTYHVYLHSLEAILAENSELRQQYISEARHYAQQLKCKYFTAQVNTLEL